MKKAKMKRAKKIAVMAIVILTMIIGYTFAVSPKAAVGTTTAMALVIGGISLTDEQEKLYNAMTDNMKNEVEKWQKGYISETKAKELIAQHIQEYKDATEKEINPKKLQEFQDQVDKLGADVLALKEGLPTEKEAKSLLKHIEEHGDKMIKELGQMNGKYSMTIPLKSLFVDKSTVTPSSLTTYHPGFYVPGFGQLSFKRMKIAQLMSQFPIGADSGGIIYYTDQSSVTRNAASRSIGSSAAESVIEWTGHSKKLEVITDTLPFAKEMLTRYALMDAEIRQFIMNNLLLKEDSLLLNATGNTPEFYGVYTTASAFDASSYTGYKPTFGGLIDLIIVMKTEIEKNTQYVVDTVVLNPIDAAGVILEKTSFGQRMNFEMMDNMGNMVIKGVNVVTSASQTANTLTIGDFTRARRYYGESIQLEFGYNASGDFAKRIITLLGQIEETLVIRNCEADAFLKSTDIASDIISITAATA